MKKVVNGVDLSSLNVQFTIDGATDQVTAYVYGSAAWCSACHGRFNRGPGSGHTPDSYNATSFYRHPVGVGAAIPAGYDATVLTGTPLENTKVVCLTCHRAHGTSTAVSVDGYAYSWTRDDDTTGSGSVLLRRGERGVCVNCHGSAEYNRPVY